jgi:hypothetical protein
MGADKQCPAGLASDRLSAALPAAATVFTLHGSGSKRPPRDRLGLSHHDHIGLSAVIAGPVPDSGATAQWRTAESMSNHCHSGCFLAMIRSI